MSDWITTITCSVAVLTGLNTTIFLLSIYKKALPALPISITFGMIFFFVGKFVLVPYLQNLGIQLIAV
ncbi:14049_t:CDS:2 [Entrophospora sp. SA101]|nr:19971_t:CDS:2 [Entrophospora sp. SA101]CAJ0761982.1 14049_t:CDS:2 [Entrophospora sp. SA101]